MDATLLVYSTFERFDKSIVAGLDLVLHIKNGLSLAALLFFQTLDFFLELFLFFQTLGGARPAFGVADLDFGEKGSRLCFYCFHDIINCLGQCFANFNRFLASRDDP